MQSSTISSRSTSARTGSAPELIGIFQRHRVWDYSKQNAIALNSLGVKVDQIVPIGYVKELTRIQHAPKRDIDVLFFGSMNSRRKQIIDRMRAAGLQVISAFGVYGKQRDELISRAKLVLNVHYYDAKVLEIVRISYLLANRCAVLSEYSSNPADDTSLIGGVAFTDYHHLVQRARELIASPAERKRLARQGFKIMSGRNAGNYLKTALTQDSSAYIAIEDTSTAQSTTSVPKGFR